MVRSNDRFGKGKIGISLYQFIASEYELPPLLSPKLHHSDGSDRDKIASPDDLGDLEIVQEMIGYLFVDITAYTKLKHIYRLNLDFTPERVERLHAYLKENCQPGQQCELWTIDMGARDWDAIHEGLSHLQRNDTTVQDLTLEQLIHEYDNGKFGDKDLPRLLVIA